MILNHPYIHFMSQETLWHRFLTAHQDFKLELCSPFDFLAGGDSYVGGQLPDAAALELRPRTAHCRTPPQDGAQSREIQQKFKFG